MIQSLIDEFKNGTVIERHPDGDMFVIVNNGTDEEDLDIPPIYQGRRKPEGIRGMEGIEEAAVFGSHLTDSKILLKFEAKREMEVLESEGYPTDQYEIVPVKMTDPEK